MNADWVIRQYLTRWFGPDHQHVLDVLKSSFSFYCPDQCSKQQTDYCHDDDAAKLVIFQGINSSFLNAFPSHLFCTIPSSTICTNNSWADKYVSGRTTLDHGAWSHPLIKVVELSNADDELCPTKVMRYLSPESKIVIRELNRFAVAVEPFRPYSIFVFVPEEYKLKHDLKNELKNKLKDKTVILSLSDLDSDKPSVDASVEIIRDHLFDYVKKYGHVKEEDKNQDIVGPKERRRPIQIQVKHLVKQDYEF